MFAPQSGTRSYIGRAWVAIRDRDIAAETIGHQCAALQTSRLYRLGRDWRHSPGASAPISPRSSPWRNIPLELAIVYLAMIIVGGMGSVDRIGTGCGVHHACCRSPSSVSFEGLPWQLRHHRLRRPAGRDRRRHHRLSAVRAGRPDRDLSAHRRTYFERWPFRYRELKAGGAR